MDVQEGHTILRNGDGYMMKNYIARHANGDKALALSIVNSFRKEISKARVAGWFFVIAGIFLLLMVIGIFFIPLGIWRLSQARRAERVLDEGYSLWLSGQSG